MLRPRLFSISQGTRLANSSGAKAIWYMALLCGPTGRSPDRPKANREPLRGRLPDRQRVGALRLGVEIDMGVVARDLGDPPDVHGHTAGHLRPPGSAAVPGNG